MATEVLVNDGGAPARIIPLTAGATVSGGHCLEMQADGEVDPSPNAAAVNTIGFALTDASSGSIASVITGRGVVINALVTGTVASGAALMVDSASATERTAKKAWDTAKEADLKKTVPAEKPPTGGGAGFGKGKSAGKGKGKGKKKK